MWQGILHKGVSSETHQNETWEEVDQRIQMETMHVSNVYFSLIYCTVNLQKSTTLFFFPEKRTVHALA